MYILNQKDFETIYSENSKIYVRCNNELYTLKNRLYELENILNKKSFIRISSNGYGLSIFYSICKSQYRIINFE